MRSSVTSINFISYRKADIIQTPRNEVYKAVRKEDECEQSDTEATAPTKVTTPQEADVIYANVDPTQLCTLTSKNDGDQRLCNVYAESDSEATDPTYGNVTIPTKQGSDTTTHASVNVVTT